MLTSRVEIERSFLLIEYSNIYMSFFDFAIDKKSAIIQKQKI